MPKRIVSEAKRVPLNCLVLPETLERLRAAAVSQGVAVDMAVAAQDLRRSDLCPDVLTEFKRLQEQASVKVLGAVDSGLLPRISTQHGHLPAELVRCVDCGKQAQHYDHRDYLEPLVVEPVCQSCNYRRGLAVDTFNNHPEYWLDLKNHVSGRKRGNGGRPAVGKPLTLRLIRLDDDVWAECQRLGKEHGTINEGLRVAFGWLSPLASQGDIKPVAVEVVAARRNNKVFKRELRPKGDKSR